MTALSQLRLWICEFFIHKAIVVMPPREGDIYARHFRQANREAWAPAWREEKHFDKWQ